MDVILPQLLYNDCLPSSHAKLLSGWDFNSSESDCCSVYSSASLSPVSSNDSSSFSPPYLPCASSQEVYSDVFRVQSLAEASEERLHSLHQRRKTRSRYLSRKRQSASEREKLRMRNLSQAVHNLRTYLPPSVAPAGQNLTKIETLRLAIRYISHLSELLGVSEEE
uniref:BHLH domain-containing protein n=2 Tax=Latimeria chalumnae TaxID=7897 RepID=H3BFZ2_LATCH